MNSYDELYLMNRVLWIMNDELPMKNELWNVNEWWMIKC
jgi:hypothetical protein